MEKRRAGIALSGEEIGWDSLEGVGNRGWMIWCPSGPRRGRE